METHNGLTGMIVEKTTATNAAGETVQFDGMWSSSLTASTAKGKPDIEVVDTRERLTLVQETLSVTSKPMIYDADTGGVPEIFSFTVQALEDLGVSAAIIEDKAGLKQKANVLRPVVCAIQDSIFTGIVWDLVRVVPYPPLYPRIGLINN